jgi:hypothetical protein
MAYKYFEVAEELERKVAAGTATYQEKQMAERLGVPVSSRMAYKDNGTTYKERGTTGRSFKAADVDTDKLGRLLAALKGMGIDIKGFINSPTPEKQMDGLVQSISDWLLQPGAGPWPGTGGTGVSKINDKTLGISGGPGVSSSVPRSGGPAAGPNPARSQAAQKGNRNQTWEDVAAQLLRGPGWGKQ